MFRLDAQQVSNLMPAADAAGDHGLVLTGGLAHGGE
jgi:hypothetical protein